MINFRFHLVSLAAVFLALSIGIVLGSGPLKGTVNSGVTTALSREVAALRADKSALNDQLAAEQAGRTAEESLLSALAGSATAKRLADHQVAVVVLPSAGADLLAATRQSVVDAGGAVAGVIEIDEAWIATRSAEVTAVVTDLAQSLTVTATTTSPDLGAAILAKVLLSTSGAGAVTADVRNDTVQRLTDAGLVSVDGDPVGAATDVVIVGGPIETGATLAERESAAASWANLAGGFVGASGGRVLAVRSATEVTDTEQVAASIATAVREARDIANGISTIDNADSAMGQISTVLAVVANASGTSGHYGLAAGAGAPYAPLGTP